MSSELLDTNPYGKTIAVGALNQGAQLGVNAVTQYGNKALDAVSNAGNQAQGYLSSLYGQAQNTISPQVQGSYSALDKYFDALGIARPQAGFASTAKLGQVNQQMSGVQQQVQSLQSRLDQTKTAWENRDQRNPGSTITDYYQANDAYNQQMPQLQKQLQDLQGQASSLNQGQTAVDPAQAQAGVLQGLRDTPGYQFTQQQGTDSIRQAASASGTLNSGRTLLALDKFSTGLADTTYQNYVNNLATSLGIVNPFASQSASLSADQAKAGAAGYLQTGQSLGSIYNDLGTSVASIRTNQAGGVSALMSAGQAANATGAASAAAGKGYLSGFKGTV